MGTRLHIVVSEELVARVDEARGLVPRSAWLRAAVEQALSEAKGSSAKQQADRGSVPSSEGVRSAAPAEQPEPQFIAEPPGGWATGYQPEDGPFRRAGSVQAKRDVRPVPKAKP